jgi:hypothetical protein
MDERELQQELLNCAVGPLEDVMYDTLGGKVDSLSETDLLEELEKLATVKTVTVVQAVDSPTHTHDQPALAMGNIVNMTIDHESYYHQAVLPAPCHDLRGEPGPAANSPQKPSSQ